MSAMPDYPQSNDTLSKLDLAHKGYEQACIDYDADVQRELARLAAKHNPFVWAATSVLYEAMGNAALAGFSPAEMSDVMDCDGH